MSSDFTARGVLSVRCGVRWGVVTSIEPIYMSEIFR